MASPAQELGLRGALGWENTRVSCFLRSWEEANRFLRNTCFLPKREQGGGCLVMGWLKGEVGCPEQGNGLCTGN